MAYMDLASWATPDHLRGILMKRIVLLVSLAFTIGAFAQQATLTKMVEYWKQKLSKEILPGTPSSEILQWARKSHRLASTSLGSSEISVRLDTIPGKPSPPPEECIGHLIFATLKLDGKDRLSTVSVDTREEKCIF